MTCADFQRVLAGLDGDGGAAVAGVADHMGACAPCRALFGFVSKEPQATAPLSPALIDSIAARILADLRPVVPIPSSRHFARRFSIVSIGVALAGLALFRPLGIFLMGPLFAALVLAGILICAGVATGLLTRQMVPGASQRLAPAPFLVVVPLGLASLFVALFPMHPGADFLKRAVVCIIIAVGAAIPAGGVFFALLRRGAVMHPRVAGSTAGLLAGLVGLVILEIHCPLLDSAHIVCSHVAAIVITTLAGLVASPFTQAAKRSNG